MFCQTKKVIYGKGEDDVLGQKKVILLAEEVVHGSGEFDQSDGTGEDDQMGQKKLYMGQESLVGWDRRR